MYLDILADWLVAAIITRFTLGLGIPEKEGVWEVKREERCFGVLAIVDF